MPTRAGLLRDDAPKPVTTISADAFAIGAAVSAVRALRDLDLVAVIGTMIETQRSDLVNETAEAIELLKDIHGTLRRHPRRG